MIRISCWHRNCEAMESKQEQCDCTDWFLFSNDSDMPWHATMSKNYKEIIHRYLLLTGLHTEMEIKYFYNLFILNFIRCTYFHLLVFLCSSVTEPELSLNRIFSFLTWFHSKKAALKLSQPYFKVKIKIKSNNGKQKKRYITKTAPRRRNARLIKLKNNRR